MGKHPTLNHTWVHLFTVLAGRCGEEEAVCVCLRVCVRVGSAIGVWLCSIVYLRSGVVVVRTPTLQIRKLVVVKAIITL
jgi:hypothetical protein